MKGLDEIKNKLHDSLIFNDWDANIYAADQTLNIEAEIRSGLLNGKDAVVIKGISKTQLLALQRLGYIFDTIGDFCVINITETIKKTCDKCGEEILPTKNVKYCPKCRRYQSKRTESQRRDLSERKKIGLVRCRDLKRKHKLTPGEYAAMLAHQNNGCRICGTPYNGTGKRLAIDHDHATGKIRGLLCTRCNMGLGLFEDNVTFLEAAIDYLNSASSET